MKTSHRRLLGFISGFILGLVYSLMANTINLIAMPNIPFHFPWPGPIPLIVGSSLVTGVMGLITVWTDETFIGMLIAAFFGASVSAMYTYYTEGTPPTFIVLAVMLFIPRLFFYLPSAVAVQWIVHQWQRITLVDTRNPGKIIAPLVCFLLAVGSGTFALYAPEIRYALNTTNDLIQQSVSIEVREELPKPLQDVWYYVDFARGDYTMEVSLEPDRLPVQRPIAEYGKLVSLIIVRYDNGFTFGCVYTPPRIMPVCGNFSFTY